MDLRHKVVMIPPDINKADGDGTKQVLTQMLKQFNDMFKNVYDDLDRIRVNVVSSLPSATSENYGRIYLLNNAGADDTMHIVIYDGLASGYKFQEISLS